MTPGENAQSWQGMRLSANLKISVVVTAYNAESFIGPCLDSVLGQSYPPHEILVCDDCSTDDTARKIRSYGERVICINQTQNVGPLRNTLAGLQRASGDLVAFIDGDDVWPFEKLSRVAIAFRENPRLLLISHNHDRVNESGKSLHIIDDTHKNTSKICSRASSLEGRSKLFRHSILHRYGFWLGSAYVIRRSKLDLPRFTEMVSVLDGVQYAYMDMVMAPFLVQTNPEGLIDYLPDITFKYRIHSAGSGSGSTVAGQRRSIERLRATNRITAHCLRASGASESVGCEFRLIDEELNFMDDLYRFDIPKAFSRYFKLIPFFIRRKRLLKESLRFGLVLLFGPSHFLRHK